MLEKPPPFANNFEIVREISELSIDTVTSLAKDYTLIGILYRGANKLTGSGDFEFHTKPLDGYSHIVFKDNEREPSCCGYHQDVFKTILPQLSDADDQLALAQKCLTALAYTEDYISSICKDYSENKIPEHHLNHIYEYVEYSCASFGVGGFGHQFYMDNLKDFVKNSEIDDKTKHKALEFVTLAENVFYQTGFSLQANQDIANVTNRWVKLFPFELLELADITKEMHDRPIVPITCKKNAFGVDLLFIKKQINDDVIEVLTKKSERLLEKISSVYLFEKGLLADINKRKLELLVSGRKHELKTGYLTSEKSREAYLDTIEKWFVDEKDFLKEISPLIKSEVKTKPVLQGNTNISVKLISFSNKKVITKVLQLLSGYFPDNESNLKTALEGQKLAEPIVFPYSQNKLVEVFRRLKYNGYIPNKTSEIRDWLCANFHYRYKSGQTEEIRPLNPDSVWAILSKGRGEPTKRERICFENVDWLIYKSALQLSRETESEQI